MDENERVPRSILDEGTYFNSQNSFVIGIFCSNVVTNGS